ncbi:MAG: hypothetical protein ACYTHJ_19935 [Planctomycetota bacterium]
MHDTSPIMAKDDKCEEYSKRRCRHREEIDGDDVSGMIVEKGPPRLRGRLTVPNYVLVYGCFGHVIAEKIKLGVNSRCARV